MIFTLLAQALTARTSPIPILRIGLVQRDIKDVTGKPYGAEFASAVEDKFTEVTYMYPRPGEDKRPVEKVGLATKVAGYICVVGYYK